MSVTLTPRTDNFDRLEYPKGTYPLAGDWWVPIDDARNIEIELIEMTRAHDNAVAQCRETIRELAQARAELAAEREKNRALAAKPEERRHFNRRVSDSLTAHGRRVGPIDRRRTEQPAAGEGGKNA